MKITKRQLRKIIREARGSLGVDFPLAPFTDEDSEKKDDLLGMYSDAYKYRYNVRPSGDTMQHMFATMTADEIGKEIDIHYDAAHATMDAEEEQQRASADRAREEKELKAMQPDPEHREELSKRSGMRRRTEGVLRQVIREAFLPNLPYAPIPMKSRASAIVLDALGERMDYLQQRELASVLGAKVGKGQWSTSEWELEDLPPEIQTESAAKEYFLREFKDYPIWTYRMLQDDTTGRWYVNYEIDLSG